MMKVLLNCVTFIIRAGVFLLLFPFVSHAQEVLSGKIVETHSGKAIPYATVGLINQNSGTNTNALGEFSIRCNQPDLDSILVSCVGYKTIRLAVRNLRSDPVVSLSINEKQLTPVLIKDHWIYDELGSFNVLKNHYLTSNGYQSQIAKKLTASIAETWLSSVKVQTDKNKKRSMFRVRIYDLDPVSKGPGIELTDSLVQVTSNGGVTSIDMSPYHIWLPGKDFFVSIEWLHIPFNEYRSPANHKGQEKASLLYKPYICFTKEAPTGDLNIWQLTHSGNWKPMFSSGQRHGIAISATVRH